MLSGIAEVCEFVVVGNSHGGTIVQSQLRILINSSASLATAVSPTAEINGFHATSAHESNYVWPNVDVEGASVGQVLLITAPGAGGKSMASRAIANQLNCPLLDLSMVKAGGSTLVGTLSTTLGFAQAGVFFERLQQGSAALVLDALDEAYLGAGREYYNSFLADIARTVRGADPKNQIIALGRPQTIRDTRNYLVDEGIVVAAAEIRPFDFAQARMLIDKTLDEVQFQGDRYKLHRINVQPFAVLRDRLLLQLAQALGAENQDLNAVWHEVQDFLGYPPVLEAIARSLAVSNFTSPEVVNGVLETRIEGARPGGDLLLGITKQLLLRESLKVQLALTGELASDDRPFVGLLYGFEEQCLRILAETSSLGADLNIRLPGSLSEEGNALYSKRVTGFVKEHPFLAERRFGTIVFSDFIRAYVCCSEMDQICEISNRDLLAALPRVGPFFAAFVDAISRDTQANLSGRSVDNETPRVREAYLNDLLASHAMAVGTDAFATYITVSDTGFLELMSNAAAGQSYQQLSFEVTELQGVVEFVGALENVIFVLDCGVILGSGHGEVRLGPRVAVLATDIEVHCRTLVVSGGTEGTVFLTAQSAPVYTSFELIVKPPHSLQVAWPEVKYPWSPYALIRSANSGLSRAGRLQIGVALRRILSSFKRSPSGPVQNAEFMDSVIVGSRPVPKVCLQALLELGVIERSASGYVLVFSVLSQHSVSFSDLRSPDFAAALDGLALAVHSTEAGKSFVLQ